MKVFSSINDYNYEGKSYLTIGTFDGVHLGHQEIIKNLVSEAHTQNNLAIVLTFFPHPRNVINRSRSVKLIDSISEKEKKLKFLGVDVLIIHPFNRKFSDLSANQYVKSVLIEKLKISKIFVGYDHRFGKNRSATVSDLIKYGIKYNFKVTVIEAKEIDEISVSSTKIRNALSEGNINLVNKFLGHDYQIEGEVIHDQGLGSKIGFPTANIELNSKNKALPMNGVYWVYTIFKDKLFFGMLNYGERPTLEIKKLTIEVHFFNLNKNLYNKDLKIYFKEKIRDEKKFDSLNSLKNQLQIDKKTCLNLEKIYKKK
ncbi:MAG: riboflavin biosynthesis protein RibF [Flavobacteriales bacterium]|nr:riboflavin biosynthesis protein RibF [Flavobacteriales bacterium]